MEVIAVRRELSLVEVFNRLDREVNRFWRDLDSALPLSVEPGRRNYVSPPVDLLDFGDRYQLEIEVPGIRRRDLALHLTGRTLVVRGKRRQSTAGKAWFGLRPRRWRYFRRQIGLPADSQLEAIQATLKNGVLTVTIPKREPREVRAVPIRTAS
jgi:HSP20 family protein